MSCVARCWDVCVAACVLSPGVSKSCWERVWLQPYARQANLRCAAAQAGAPRQPCMWQLRSREEAAAAWQAEFGYLDGPAPAPAAAGAEQGAAEQAGSGGREQTMVYAVARGAALSALGTPEGRAGAAERHSRLSDERLRGQRADAPEGGLDGRMSGA